jgi:hypothetical protein
VRKDRCLVQRHRGGQLVLREVRVGHDRQDGTFLAVDVPVAEEGDAEGADVKSGAGCWVVVGYCPGLEDGFLGWGELSGGVLVLWLCLLRVVRGCRGRGLTEAAVGRQGRICAGIGAGCCRLSCGRYC